MLYVMVFHSMCISKEVWVFIMFIMTSNSFFYPMICFPCIIIPTFFHWGIYHDKLSLWKSWFYLSHENLRICADMSLTFWCCLVEISLITFSLLSIICCQLSQHLVTLLEFYVFLCCQDLLRYFCSYLVLFLFSLCSSYLTILLTMCLRYSFISVKTIFIYCISSINNVSNFLAWWWMCIPNDIDVGISFFLIHSGFCLVFINLCNKDAKKCYSDVFL